MPLVVHSLISMFYRLSQRNIERLFFKSPQAALTGAVRARYAQSIIASEAADRYNFNFRREIPCFQQKLDDADS
jgi:hypothetical protein